MTQSRVARRTDSRLEEDMPVGEGGRSRAEVEEDRSRTVEGEDRSFVMGDRSSVVGDNRCMTWRL